MQLQTILNRVEKHKRVVYSEALTHQLGSLLGLNRIRNFCWRGKTEGEINHGDHRVHPRFRRTLDSFSAVLGIPALQWVSIQILGLPHSPRTV